MGSEMCIRDRLDSLAEHMNQEVELSSPVLKMHRIMPFPESSPKLLAAIVEENDELLRLQRQVKHSAMSLGFEPEKKRFRPHVTLARKYPRSGQQLLSGAIQTLSAPATHLIVYESHLSASGARYSPLYEFDLAGCQEG